MKIVDICWSDCPGYLLVGQDIYSVIGLIPATAEIRWLINIRSTEKQSEIVLNVHFPLEYECFSIYFGFWSAGQTKQNKQLI